MSKETVDSGIDRGGQSISHTLMKRIDDIQRNAKGFRHWRTHLLFIDDSGFILSLGPIHLVPKYDGY